MTSPAQEILDWLELLPPAVQALVRRYPPGCTVVANRPLTVPGPLEAGWVVSYFEPTADHPEGLVLVASQQTGFRGQCSPDWLELVDRGPSGVLLEEERVDGQ